MDMQLHGKRVLITGASQGIGAGLAHAFAAEHCSLVLVARSRQTLKSVRQDILSRHPIHIDVEAADLMLPDCAEHLADTYPDVDILINNAGGIPAGDISQIDALRWRQAWELKVMWDTSTSHAPSMPACGREAMASS